MGPGPPCSNMFHTQIHFTGKFSGTIGFSTGNLSVDSTYVPFEMSFVLLQLPDLRNKPCKKWQGGRGVNFVHLCTSKCEMFSVCKYLHKLLVEKLLCETVKLVCLS